MEQVFGTIGGLVALWAAMSMTFGCGGFLAWAITDRYLSKKQELQKQQFLNSLTPKSEQELQQMVQAGTNIMIPARDHVALLQEVQRLKTPPPEEVKEPGPEAKK